MWSTSNQETCVLIFYLHSYQLIKKTWNIFPVKLQFLWKLDGVGPVDNRPSTNKLQHFVKKKMWHVTCDMWHVTCDTWHVTRDTFGGVDILSKFQLSSSYRLWFMILWRSGGKGSVAQSVNHKAVYRTAPATPGLLKMEIISSPFQVILKSQNAHLPNF